ncbi:hypothetical protein BDN71DRAFT_1455037, partial [Pleurotus eryngii]
MFLLSASLSPSVLADLPTTVLCNSIIVQREEPRSKVETGREPDLEIENDQHCFVHRIPMLSSPPP